MTNYRKGFTLIELVVVVLIMGILASVSVPYYYKTIETSKATDSVALGHLLGNAKRMFLLDYPGVSVSGQVTNVSCNGGTCSTGDTSACRLVKCKYVAEQDWNQSAYDFYVCHNGAGGGFCGSSGTSMSSVRRKAGAAANYAGWGYVFSSDGSCQAIGGAPTCPKF